MMSVNNNRLREAWRLLNLVKDYLPVASELRLAVKSFLQEPPPDEDEDLARVREDQIVARQERDRILRWLRVAYQLNRNAQAFADGIQRREHEMPYDAPTGVEVDGSPPMSGAEYDAQLEQAAQMRVRMEPYGRKKIDGVFKILHRAAEESNSSVLSPVHLVILDDAVREMDRHLPDFFEKDPNDDDDEG